MREITVPSSITVRLPTADQQGKHFTKEESFAEFLDDNVLIRMGTKLKDLARNLRIRAAFEAAGPGSKVKIASDDWDMMIAEIDKGDWNMFFAMQYTKFFDALRNAVEEVPVVTPPPGIPTPPEVASA